MKSRDPVRGRTVLVTDAASGSGVAVVRSLARRGWRVIAGDSNPRSPGFYSRYAAGTLVYPAPQDDPRGFVSRVTEAVRQQGVDLVVPVYDPAITPLSERRGEIGCPVAIAKASALAATRDKRATAQLAECVGVPMPRARLVQTAAEAATIGEDLGWPVVVKPYSSFLYAAEGGGQYARVAYADNATTLRGAVARFEGRCGVLLQEYYAGIGCGVELLAHEGRVLAAFQHKRLRELPFTGGISTFRESVPLDPVLYEYATRLLGALQWTGLAMVEFKVGAQGPRLIEINGRIWGSLPLAVHSGMDFPARLADLYVNGPPEPGVPPATRYRVGVKVRSLERDLRWALQVLRGKRREPFLPKPPRWKSVPAVLGLLNPVYRFDVLSLVDPIPGLVEMYEIAANAARRLAQGGPSRGRSQQKSPS